MLERVRNRRCLIVVNVRTEDAKKHHLSLRFIESKKLQKHRVRKNMTNILCLEFLFSLT